MIKTRPRARLKLTLTLGVLTVFGPLAIDMYLPAFSHIAAELKVPTGSVGFTLAAYLLGSSLGQLFYGPLADAYGRRAPLLAGCVLFGLGSLGCAAANSIPILAACRVLQAVGGAAGMVIARAVVRDLFNAREAARMYSHLMLVMGVGPVLAPTFGGQVLRWGGWRAIFLLLAGFSLTAFMLTLRALPETLPRDRRAKVSLPGTLRTFGGLLREPHFRVFSLVAGFGSGTLFAYISGSPFVFIELYGISEQNFGLLFGLNAAGFIAAAQLNHRLLRHREPRKILRGSAAFGAVAGVGLLISGATGWGGLPGLWTLLFICLLSLGLAGPNVAALALAPFGRQAGSASSLLGTAQFLIGSLAGAAVGFFHNGTALPMTAAVCLCCAGSYGMLLTRHAGEPPEPLPAR